MPIFAASPDNRESEHESYVRSVVSADGTRIAFERVGTGSPVILVDGALCRRGLGPNGDLARLLARHCCAITYDRRGRGSSQDTAPYAVEREIEDIAALIEQVGGSASLWGTSSGAVLALEASARLSGVRAVALYEPPLILDTSGPDTSEHWSGIHAALDRLDHARAVREFLRMVGVPPFFVGLMRVTPVWSQLTDLAHTLRYDGALLAELQRGRPVPTERWNAVRARTLVMAGSKSPGWMRNGNSALSRVLPNAEFRVIDGQSHRFRPKALMPYLLALFAEGSRTAS